MAGIRRTRYPLSPIGEPLRTLKKPVSGGFTLDTRGDGRSLNQQHRAIQAGCWLRRLQFGTGSTEHDAAAPFEQ